MTISRLFEIPGHQQTHYPQSDALAFKEDETWKSISIDALISKINNLSYGLLESGVQVGDKIAMVSSNRPEWIIMDYAIQQVGAISVPLYPTITVADYKFILNDSLAKMVFVEDQQLFDKVAQAVAGMDVKPKVFSFEPVEGAPFWKDLLLSDGSRHHDILEKIKTNIDKHDLVTIIYTSGTTGNPKGVMLSHDNILSNAIAVANAFPADGPNVRTLSFLPLCHIFERTSSFMSVYLGVSIYFAQSMDTIGENLREVKPHYFSAVPRLLEKTYEKIMDKGMSLSGLKLKLFEWAVNLGNAYDLPVGQGWWYRFQLGIANKLVFNKWREALGGNVEFIVSGAAALHSGICRMFWAAQIPILEAYGLTESSPGVTLTPLDYENARIGCVGPPLEGVEVKIAVDGEILVKGPNVMKGYYQRPDLTEQVIDEEGWLHTGDIGALSSDHVLKITDRKKEMFKTSGGKYIAPQLLENAFKESPYIDQMMVVGEGEKFPAALIVPSLERLKQWAKALPINTENDQVLLDHQETKDLFKEIVDLKNNDFAQFEKVKKFYLVTEEWSVNSGELTPTLKLKRRVILAKYQDKIQSFYR